MELAAALLRSPVSSIQAQNILLLSYKNYKNWMRIFALQRTGFKKAINLVVN